METVQSIFVQHLNDTISIGDTVNIYQGRFGHQNIMTIRTIFTHAGNIYVSNAINATTGTYANAIHYKVDNAFIKNIQKTRAIANRYSQYQILP